MKRIALLVGRRLPSPTRTSSSRSSSSPVPRSVRGPLGPRHHALAHAGHRRPQRGGRHRREARERPVARLPGRLASRSSSPPTAQTTAPTRSSAGTRIGACACSRWPRVGKATALNAAVAGRGGEMLVFSDANSIFAPDALRALVRPFADPRSRRSRGRPALRLGSDGVGAIASGEQRYWDLDRMLKTAESRGRERHLRHRRDLRRAPHARSTRSPRASRTTSVTSTGVIARGLPTRLRPRRGRLRAGGRRRGALEFGRKVRVMTRGLRARPRAAGASRPPGATASMRSSSSRTRCSRRMMVFPLAVIAVTSPLSVATRTPVSRGDGDPAGALRAGCARARARRQAARAAQALSSLPAFFCFVNASRRSKAIWNLVRGRRIDRWEPRRAEPRADRRKPEGERRRCSLSAAHPQPSSSRSHR